MEKGNKKHFKVKKMFSSLLLSYGALLIVPFWIVFMLLHFWDTSTENYYKEIVNNNLTERRMDFEKKLEVLQAGASSLFYDSQLGWVCSLDGLHPGDINVSDLLKFSEKLNEAFADTSNYNDYCVIMNNEFVFRRPSMYVGRNFFYEHFRNYMETGYEKWIEQSFQSKSWMIFPMQQIKLGDTTVEAMTYSYPIRTGFKRGGEADAVVQFLLTKQELLDMFSVLVDMEGIVCIFDTDGTLLAEISEEETETGGMLKLEDLPAGGEGEVKVLNGMKRFVMSQSTTDGMLTFAVMLPAEVALMDLEHTTKMAWLVLTVGVVFELALGCRFAMRFSGPIKNLLENMQRMFVTDGAGEWAAGSSRAITEFQFLEANVHALMNTNRSMQLVLQEKSAREKVNFLSLLFGGEFDTDREAEEEARHVGVDLSAPYHYVLVLYMEGGMEKLVELPEDASFSFVRANYMADEHRAALLIACDTTEPEEMESRRAALEDALKQRSLDYVYMGIGRIYGGKRDIAFSFRQACYCVDRAIREKLQPGGVKEYKYALLEQNMPWYPGDVEERLINVTKRGKSDEVEKIFTMLREENIQKVHLSQTVGKMLMSNIMFTLLELYNSMTETRSITEIIERIGKENDPEKSLALLEEQFLELSGSISTSHDEKAEGYYERLREYMEANYQDRQFSISMAAEGFGLSESYFSTFFKEIMGKSFSSFLENMRLEKAKELISEGSYDLEAISRMVGYASSATFRRAFKRAYGVAPSDWKNQ